MNYINFNEYLNKYLKFKQLHEHKKLNPTNFIYKRCKLNESLLHHYRRILLIYMRHIYKRIQI